MFGLTMPQEYHRMTDDFAALVYTDNFFVVYQKGKYYSVCHNLVEAEEFTALADISVYEVNKDTQKSRRVF